MASNSLNFEKTVKWMLQNYSAAAAEATFKVVPQVAKEAAQKLKQTSPKRQGKYARSWKVRQEKSRVKVMATVFSDKPEYRLTHLLEYGHAKRGGGRVQGIEHIAPVEEWANNEAVDRIIEEIRRMTI